MTGCRSLGSYNLLCDPKTQGYINVPAQTLWKYFEGRKIRNYISAARPCVSGNPANVLFRNSAKLAVHH